MIMLLFLNDLHVGVLCFPLLSAVLEQQGLIFQGSGVICGVFMTMMGVFARTSIGTLLAMNIEIDLAVIHPVCHRTEVTKRSVLILTSVQWLQAILVVFSMNVVDNKIGYSIINTVAMALTIGFMHAKIFYTHKLKRKIISQLAKQGTCDTKTFFTNMKLVKSYLILFLCTVACCIAFPLLLVSL